LFATFAPFAVKSAKTIGQLRAERAKTLP